LRRRLKISPLKLRLKWANKLFASLVASELAKH
jgi:hypothetical protein